MSEYQAIYDAVRSRICNGDIGQSVESAFREAGIGHWIEMAAHGVIQAADSIASEQTRPSVVFKPAISVDGNQFCALYGSDLQSGVAGFGESADEAMRDFDVQWVKRGAQRPPVPGEQHRHPLNSGD